MSEAERVEDLRRRLEHHAHRYYVLDDPEIGDDEYDALFRELQALEEAHPELASPDSPTQRVGGEPVSDLRKVTHDRPMLSLANARSAEELRAWVARMRNHLAREGIENPEFAFVAEPKIDGLAISLLYRDGILVRGATRGNGEVGEDVTHNLRTIPTIPLRIEGDAPALEHAVAVEQGDRQPVDLRLGDELEARVLDPLAGEVRAHAGDPGAQLLLRARVGQRQHRLQVGDLLQARHRLAADALGRRVGRQQLGVLGLDGAQLVEQRVVGVVADLRIVEDVVAVAVVGEDPAQLLRPGGDLAGDAHSSISFAAGSSSRARS